jgi:hypothetical protein
MRAAQGVARIFFANLIEVVLNKYKFVSPGQAN